MSITRSQERVSPRHRPARTTVRQWRHLIPVLAGAALVALAASGCGGEAPAHADSHDTVAHSHDAGAHSHGVTHSHDGVAHGHDAVPHSHTTDQGGAVPAVDDPDVELPDSRDNAERDLYFTPRGRYTDADIVANGPVLPARKYARIHANHSLKTKPGDRICPITLTRANPKFSWVIGGKTYLFCCPPCIDDFVRTAKESPNEIQAPEAYVKR